MKPSTEPIPDPIPLKKLPAIGDTVFLFEKRPSGTWKYSAGEVIDLNKHVQAVKIRYSLTKTKIGSNWFPLSKLTATAPANPF